jgi:hypothetical protein
MGMIKVKAMKKPTECLSTNLHYLRFTVRPTEIIFLETLHPDAKPIFSPIKDLDYIPFSVAESKQAPGKQVQIEMFFDQK